VSREEHQSRSSFLSFALSGFTALALEVIWTRLIAVLTLGAVYGFTLMLAVLLRHAPQSTRVSMRGAR